MYVSALMTNPNCQFDASGRMSTFNPETQQWRTMSPSDVTYGPVKKESANITDGTRRWCMCYPFSAVDVEYFQSLGFTCEMTQPTGWRR